MRMPFQRLMEEVAALSGEDRELPLGVLAERWHEPLTRIMDAIDAVRVTRGEQTYLPVVVPARRCWIAQVVRPDGTVLTDCLSPEDEGPSLRIGETPIAGEAYGRWRLSDASEWKITYYWPDGPHRVPAYCDLTGAGAFVPIGPGREEHPRDEAADRLRAVDR